MKGSICIAAIFTLLIVPAIVSARHIQNSHHGNHHPTRRDSSSDTMVRSEFYWGRRPRAHGHGRPETVQVAGSTLPDCSHACGSCTPCRLVMVSFVCSSIEEAETCPMAYKCMCNNKSYPVP